LKTSRTQNSLWNLVKYLRKEKLTVLLSAMHYANEIALWTGALARVPTKVVICEHTHYPSTLRILLERLNAGHRSLPDYFILEHIKL
jgi:hypothetical protein